LGYQETGKVSATWASNMPWVEQNYIKVIQTLRLQDTAKYSPKVLIPSPSAAKSDIVSNIVDDKSLDFLSKKKVLSEGVVELYRDTAQKYDAYDVLKKEV
jgi:hypothetical protein